VPGYPERTVDHACESRCGGLSTPAQFKRDYRREAKRGFTLIVKASWPIDESPWGVGPPMGIVSCLGSSQSTQDGLGFSSIVLGLCELFERQPVFLDNFLCTGVVEVFLQTVLFLQEFPRDF
jgi:hypothetical protein